MAIDFPASPTVNQLFAADDKLWQWDGVAWTAYLAANAASIHGQSHGSAGVDPVTLAQSQVTGLTTDLAAKAPLASPIFSGNVGIGTSSPTSRLVVNGGTGTSQTRFEVNTTQVQEVSTNAAQNAYADRLSDASSYIWKITGSERMRIDASGNVGIGTSSPAERLRVDSTAGSANWIVRARNVGIGNDTGIWADASNNMQFAGRNGAGNLSVVVQTAGSSYLNGGNVGIGTSSPADKLDVAGTIRVVGSAPAGSRTLLFNNSSASVDYGTLLGHLNASGYDAQISLGGTGGSADRISLITGDGAGNVTERFRLGSAGLITGTGTSLGAWTAYTPTFTGFTKGNATLDFAYSKIGKTVHFRGSFIFGSTSVMTGPLDFTLPFQLSSGYTFIQNIGRVTVWDISGPVYFGDMVKISGGAGGDTVRCVMNLASTVTLSNQEIGATTPMTWTTGDVLFVNGTYEAA